jgi:peptidoglycan/xylan/chitin deacetylase (PgdA/CDA1 family)
MSEEAKDFFVVLTMDCEPALFERSPLALKLSGSGPADYD